MARSSASDGDVARTDALEGKVTAILAAVDANASDWAEGGLLAGLVLWAIVRRAASAMDGNQETAEQLADIAVASGRAYTNAMKSEGHKF